ncbi:putative phosphoenolpyruvate synthase [uncultured archaeon]|nr:putative phosphoenolpyruvate synthase [uncultured archaeon]
MKNVMWFEEIRKENLAEVGGKGANLGEMTYAKFPIPPGFVVTSGAYFDFVKANKIDAFIQEMTDELDVSNNDKLMRASEMIKGRIMGGRISDSIRNDIINSYRQLCQKRGRQVYVAVRSSATAEDLPEASFAGQQSTFLNVQGEAEVVQNVKECWASLFEPRSIFYRVNNHFDHLKVGLAAVVQEMVQSETAGVMFTVDPVTQDLGIVSIEAAYGLGEVVVSGMVTPDRYLVRKGSWRLETKEMARQTWMITKEGDHNEKKTIPSERQALPKLSEEQIIELAKIGCRIEAHYGKPQDTEWALQEGTLYIVQARPVTTLKGESLQTVKSGRYAQLIQSEFKDVQAADSNPMDSVAAMEASAESAYVMDKSRDNYAKPSPAPNPSQAPASYPSASSKPVSVSSSASANSAQTGGSSMSTPSGSGQVLLTGLAASPGVGKGKVRILASPREMDQMLPGEILVTEMTTPDFVPAMKKAAAILTNTGGMTCHAAIVSRELGVPCIVGTREATTKLQPGQFLTVDAVRGKVYDGDVEIVGAKPAAGAPSSAGGAAAGGKYDPTAFAGEAYVPTGTKIYVNLADVDSAEKVSKLPCDGVGLLRAEFMIAGIGEHPKKIIREGRQAEYINKLADGLRTFASAFYPRPVVYRATDFKTNEYRNLKGGEEFEPKEENPMMGFRGCARYITEPDVFAMELSAIKKVRDEYGMKNLWLMIPFVRRIGELRAVKDLLKANGIHRTRDFKLWIMCEVPSTVVLIDQFCEEGIDGVSIGSNDLTQLTLGIDRDNGTLAEGFDERNDAVLNSIEKVVRSCNAHGVTVSLCGQAPSVYPEFAEKLVDFGVTSMSVNPDVVERTRRIVASAESKVMLKRLMHLEEKLAAAQPSKTDGGND